MNNIDGRHCARRLGFSGLQAGQRAQLPKSTQPAGQQAGKSLAILFDRVVSFSAELS